MKVSPLIDHLRELEENGYGLAEVVLHVNDAETGLGIIDLQERSGQVPHVVLS